MCGGFESGHEHSGETYSGEVGYVSDSFLVVAQRYLELIPHYFLGRTVMVHYRRHLFVGDIVFAYLKVLRAYGYMVLEVSFVFVESVVLIYVLDIRKSA